MTDSTAKPDAGTLPHDYTAPSLALMLLTTALGYSLPFFLYPASHSFNGPMGPEVLNLYFLVGWMGLAHFIYAYYGQARALSSMPSKILPFVSLLLLGAAALVGLRQMLGYMLFSFVMWVYFLPHFVRAEVHFTSVLEKKESHETWGTYIFPTIAFAFFTFGLFCPTWFTANPWSLLLLAVACLTAGFLMGAHRQLQDPQLSKYVLLAVFLIAEGLVWATYRKYMVFQFQQGVYVFHIAMASFFHYYRSYDFARRMGIRRGEKPGKGFLLGIVAVNLAVVAAGWLVLRMSDPGPLAFVFDVSCFTFWVGMHQYASDVFVRLKRQPQSPGAPAARRLLHSIFSKAE